MNKIRDILLSSTTPVPSLPALKLHADTWKNHILVRHPEMAGKEELVQKIMSAPKVVGITQQNAENYVLFDPQITSPSGNSVLTVFASPKDQVVVTAFYSRGFSASDVETIIWQA